jgi:hypothetical protein
LPAVYRKPLFSSQVRVPARNVRNVAEDGGSEVDEAVDPLERTVRVLTELLDPRESALDGCEWLVVAAARQVIWRLQRHQRRPSDSSAEPAS